MTVSAGRGAYHAACLVPSLEAIYIYIYIYIIYIYLQ